MNLYVMPPRRSHVSRHQSLEEGSPESLGYSLSYASRWSALTRDGADALRARVEAHVAEAMDGAIQLRPGKNGQRVRDVTWEGPGWGGGHGVRCP